MRLSNCLATERRPAPSWRLNIADAAERDAIYRSRHAVYARELRQHPENDTGALRDALDDFNSYIAAWRGDELAGYVSVTPPGRTYSFQKYFPDGAAPIQSHDRLFEVRLLTVADGDRHGPAAMLLMHAALRWVLARGGRQIAILGRSAVVPLYEKVGFRRVGRRVQSGAVTYELMSGDVDALVRRALHWDRPLRRLEAAVDWRLDVPYRDPPPCFHGGAFFEAIGSNFRTLGRRRQVVNADVLDAWFDPAPGVLEALREHLPWLLRTSPPTGCEGLIAAIAQARGVPAECILPGAGSSDLIYLSLSHWLNSGSRVLLLDPTYGEYAHVLTHVIGCRVDRLTLHREDGYALAADRLASALRRRYDLVVLVNPNSPTGWHLPRGDLAEVLAHVSSASRVWIDETYIEYAGCEQSLESVAAGSESIVVCKSMSKVYGLSGARVAYLCGPAALMGTLRGFSPPWAVSLPAQVAAVRALDEVKYYAACYRRTHALRAQLAERLRTRCGFDVVAGVANFLLCHTESCGVSSAELVARCRRDDVYLRDASNMGSGLGAHALRVAVKDDADNERIIAALEAAIR